LLLLDLSFYKKKKRKEKKKKREDGLLLKSIGDDEAHNEKNYL
jgi:hypothetical protein